MFISDPCWLLGFPPAWERRAGRQGDHAIKLLRDVAFIQLADGDSRAVVAVGGFLGDVMMVGRTGYLMQVGYDDDLAIL